jgi:Spy/CpxP family protein refolding chaperone
MKIKFRMAFIAVMLSVLFIMASRGFTQTDEKKNIPDLPGVESYQGEALPPMEKRCSQDFPLPPEGGGPQGEGASNREKHFENIIKDLNLTPEQQQLLDKNRTQNREKERRLRDEIFEKKNLLREELSQPEFNMNEIKQIHNEIKALLAQVEDNRLDGILEVRNILTAEKFREFHQKMGKHMAERYRHHKMPRPGEMEEVEK